MTIPRWSLVLGAASLLIATPTGAHTASAHSSARPITEIKQLVAAVNARRLPAIDALFAPRAQLQVGAHRWSGRKSVHAWWQDELRYRLRIVLRSGISGSGATVRAVLARTTHGGDCARVCVERAEWHFAGAQIDRMTLGPLQQPSPPPVPLRTVPPPPTAPPSPHVTPTIPT